MLGVFGTAAACFLPMLCCFLLFLKEPQPNFNDLCGLVIGWGKITAGFCYASYSSAYVASKECLVLSVWFWYFPCFALYVGYSPTSSFEVVLADDLVGFLVPTWLGS